MEKYDQNQKPKVVTQPVIKTQLAKEFSQSDVKNVLNNYILYTQIDVAIEDAIFAQSHIGKDIARFVKPLLEARNLCKYILVPDMYKAEQNASVAPEVSDVKK